jgi:hypothetical protein
MIIGPSRSETSVIADHRLSFGASSACGPPSSFLPGFLQRAADGEAWSSFKQSCAERCGSQALAT